MAEILHFEILRKHGQTHKHTNKHTNTQTHKQTDMGITIPRPPPMGGEVIIHLLGQSFIDFQSVTNVMTCSLTPTIKSTIAHSLPTRPLTHSIARALSHSLPSFLPSSLSSSLPPSLRCFTHSLTLLTRMHDCSLCMLKKSLSKT